MGRRRRTRGAGSSAAAVAAASASPRRLESSASAARRRSAATDARKERSAGPPYRGTHGEHRRRGGPRELAGGEGERARAYCAPSPPTSSRPRRGAPPTSRDALLLRPDALLLNRRRSSMPDRGEEAHLVLHLRRRSPRATAESGRRMALPFPPPPRSSSPPRASSRPLVRELLHGAGRREQEREGEWWGSLGKNEWRGEGEWRVPHVGSWYRG
ncbi:unnamed protein product [Urochloa humidicola]